ncbi:MAG: PHP domain-containing protein [Halothermotrichaceae bacterium]
MKIIGDFHTHSQYSHGRGDLRANVEAAVARGFRQLAITDHGPRTFNFIRLGVKRPEQLLDIKKEIENLNYEYSEIDILAGVEANIVNSQGELDVPDNILAELDLAAAGLHLLLLPPDINSAREIIFNNRILYKYFPEKRMNIRKTNTQAVINAVKKHRLDFITHPGYKLDIDTYSLASVCAANNTALEINARHGSLTEGFVKAASQTEVKFVINSDAHSPEQVGKIGPGLEIVKKLKIAPERIINYYGFNRKAGKYER